MRLRVFVSFFPLRGPSPPVSKSFSGASERLRCRLIRVPPLDVGFVFLSFDFDVFFAVLDSSSSSSSSSSSFAGSHSSATLPLPVVFVVKVPFVFRKTPSPHVLPILSTSSSCPKASFSKAPTKVRVDKGGVLDVCLRVDTGISKSSLSLKAKQSAEEEPKKGGDIYYYYVGFVDLSREFFFAENSIEHLGFKTKKEIFLRGGGKMNTTYRYQKRVVQIL